MMDGPRREVIYNLSLLCVSVRQLRQTERDKDRQKQRDVLRVEGRTKKKMKLLFISARFFISSRGVLQLRGESKNYWRQE